MKSACARNGPFPSPSNHQAGARRVGRITEVLPTLKLRSCWSAKAAPCWRQLRRLTQLFARPTRTKSARESRSILVAAVFHPSYLNSVSPGKPIPLPFGALPSTAAFRVKATRPFVPKHLASRQPSDAQTQTAPATPVNLCTHPLPPTLSQPASKAPPPAFACSWRVLSGNPMHSPTL